MKITKFLGCLLLICYYHTPTLFSQEVKEVRIHIIDNNNGNIIEIDTTVLSALDQQKVLRALGYDQMSISQSKATPNRKISISTEEIITYPIKKMTESYTLPISPTPNNKPNIQQPNKKPAQKQQFKVEDIVDIPPNAQVIDIPEGKKIITKHTDENGNEVIEETTVTIEQGRPSTNWTPWKEVKEDNKQNYRLLPSSSPQPTIHNQSYTNRNGDGTITGPDIRIAIGELDMFDASTLHKKDKQLLNAAPLAIQNFSITPEYNEGYFRFAFSLPAKQIARLAIYDVIGTPVYSEVLSGEKAKYNKLLSDFHLYKKGTFLILISQDEKKFTRKLTID